MKDVVVSTNGSRLMLRKTPSKDGDILARLPNGSALEVIFGPDEGAWLYVRDRKSGTWGYVAKRWVKEVKVEWPVRNAWDAVLAAFPALVLFAVCVALALAGYYFVQ